MDKETKNKKRSFFITAAFPYPNSPQHIGHARTYTITDIYARFKRQQGFDVLFPMGFHVTGTPIIAMAERLKEKDESLLKIFEEIYEIDRKTALSLTNPKELVMFFSKEIEQGMKELNLSIDWSRKFYTFDEHFQKFIEWQFKKLKKMGYLKKGSHYIAWSPKLKSAVGAHDTKGDIDPEIGEMSVIFLKTNKNIEGKPIYIAVATYRPETLYGLTNIWFNKNVNYSLYKINDKIVILSKKAAEKLSYQLNLEEIKEIKEEEIEKLTVENPLTKENVVIIHSNMVEESTGTGLVMSVPAHSVVDYMEWKKHKPKEIKPIIKVENYSEIPAKDIYEMFNIEKNPQKIKEATRKLYRDELKKGKMIVEAFKNVTVEAAREKIKKLLEEKGLHLTIYIIENGPIYTRAGDEVVVKKVENQWFIDYSNPEWKEKTKKALQNMKIIPEKVRKEMEDTIEWLKEKACTRSRGLGTPFPFDKSQVIESLSDSTIYMAFYTLMPEIKHYSPDMLTEEFFDYIFYGKGKPIDERHKKLRESFLYYYPLDSRHSGADLVRNHLTFFIFNHTALFPEHLWPKQIVVNGFVLMEGKKMSKSLGNILPLRKAIKQFGADSIRILVSSGAELDQDTNFSPSSAKGINERLKLFKELYENAIEDGEKNILDEWIEEEIYNAIKHYEHQIEQFKLREFILNAFYKLHDKLFIYKKIRKPPFPIKKALREWLKTLYPFAPSFTTSLEKEETLLSLPKIKQTEKELSHIVEIIEEIKKDITHVKELSNKKGKELSSITIVIPPNEAFELYNSLAHITNPKEIAKKTKGKLTKHYIKKMGNIIPINKHTYKEMINAFLPYLERVTTLKINIIEGTEGMPDKPKLLFNN